MLSIGERVLVKIEGRLCEGTVVSVDSSGSLEVQKPCADVIVKLGDGTEELIKHVPIEALQKIS